MTIYTVETGKLAQEQLDRMIATLPAQRREASLRLSREQAHRESVTAAYLVYYAFVAGDVGGCQFPDADALLSRSEQAAALSAVIGWPVAVSGKPFAQGVIIDGSRRYVSVSHSDGLVTVALHTQPVGVDVQRIPASPDRLLFIARRFHPDETAMLETVPEEALALEFCKVWACKESVMKLTGEGLQLPLDSFCVRLDGEQGVSELKARRVRIGMHLLPDAVEAHAVWV